MWKPLQIEPVIEHVQYHVDLDDKFVWEEHELLDKIPKKTIGQQVEDLIRFSESMELSRIRALDLPDVGDGDPDDADTGIDDYSDIEDIRRASDALQARIAAYDAAQKKAAEVVPPPEDHIANPEKSAVISSGIPSQS